MNVLFNWTDDVVKQMTKGELCRKMLDVNKWELDKVIDTYIAHNKREELDALPPGRLKARWLIREGKENEKERETDMNSVIKILAVMDQNKKGVH